MTNSTLQKQLIQAGATFAGLAVIAGAFGTHGIKARLEPSQFDIYLKAVEYQFYHAFGLLILGFGARRLNEQAAKVIFTFFILGIIFFCGSLYLLSTSIIWAKEPISWLGAVAPIGGVSFVIGWGYLVVKGYKPSSNENSAKKVLEMHRRKKTEE
ncbi:MAG: DUF423 domain-containing protein [Bacteroidia bacterium]|nr:DUF423 domain-containing protein [Bacteroidia bacterium]MCC7533152.1 DUF423 domain-containing protein [Bacteroidia bacterium]